MLCVFLIATLFLSQTAVACPTCKDTLGHHAIQMQQGYALSILFMIAVPFGILSAWTVAIVRMVKTAQGTGESPLRAANGNPARLQ